MAFRLTRLPSTVSITDEQARPTLAFQRWWQGIVELIEAQEATQNQLIADLQAAQSALEATQADLATTQGELATAQTELATAQSAIVAAEGDITALTNALTAYAPKAGATFTGAVDVQATLQCDALRIDVAPAVSANTVSHKVAINLNGTTYYMLLSNV